MGQVRTCSAQLAQLLRLRDEPVTQLLPGGRV